MALELRGLNLLGWCRHVTTWVLVAVVLAGGICPALYGAVLPHEHLFVGGPPPADWEQHVHPNPLVELLGSLDAPVTPVSTRTLPDPLVMHGLTAGRVVSLYAGELPLLLTIVAIDGMVPAWDQLPLPIPGLEIIFDELPLYHLTVWPPLTPPPRHD